MGWSNYIIIPQLKTIVEISRSIDDIADYEESAIGKAIDEDNIDYDAYIDGENILDIGDVPISKITVKNLSTLYKKYEIVYSLSGMDCDKFLLFWLKTRNIEFQIKSESNMDFDTYDNEGYVRISR